jgi:D-glycero-D-manno-heptose 1,7-bisphosphate phosphatase
VSTIFLDRDGVINENRVDYVKSWSEFRFLPGSREAIAKLTQAGHRIVVCSNQAGIAKGLISIETVEDIHARMLAELREAGGIVEKVYYCPHGKEENCECRKPRPGQLLRASQELGLDLKDAVFVGDNTTDIYAGMQAGVQTILVLTGLGMESLRAFRQEAVRPFRIAMNLKHAVELILKGRHIYTGALTSLERACYALLEDDASSLSLSSLSEQPALLS